MESTSPSAKPREKFISCHPIAQKLRADRLFTESRLYAEASPEPGGVRSSMFRALLVDQMMEVPPFAWTKDDGKAYVQICYLGANLCGYPEIVHGGLLAALFDDGFARCCLRLPDTRLTANLEIQYKATVVCDSYVVIRITQKVVKDRKVELEGEIRLLTDKDEDPAVLVKAKATFVTPKKGESGYRDRCLPSC